MKYRIELDSDPQSPSDYADTSLFLVANHRQCYIPEPGEKRIPETAEELVRKYRKTHWIFALEAYIHSGVRLALVTDNAPFPDRRWDVSQLGYVFAAKAEWRLCKSARKAARDKVAEWNQYLSGDVWGYIIEDETGEQVDSCWGFYGREYCEQETKAALKHASEAIPA
jgi:hypothetical protein